MSERFEHSDLVFEEIKTENKDGKRFYLTPSGPLPSITTVLGHFKKQGLLEWRKRVGEAQANKIAGQASIRGTKVHKIAEDYINNIADYREGHTLMNLALFELLQKELDTHLGKVYGQEIPLYSDYLGVAGRTDCVAEWDGKLAIIDFKTSTREKKKDWISDYFEQAAGYAVMFEERTKIPVSKLVILIAVGTI